MTLLLIITYPHFIKCCAQHGPRDKEQSETLRCFGRSKTHAPFHSTQPPPHRWRRQALRLRFPFPQSLFSPRPPSKSFHLFSAFCFPLLFYCQPPIPFFPLSIPQNKWFVMSIDWHGNPWGWGKVIEKSMCTN